MRCGLLGFFLGLGVFVPALPAPAQKAPVKPPPALPVREVTVFKDGHAFVLKQGKVRIGADASVFLPELPNPVLGTFWPYSAERNFPLRSVVAGFRTVQRERSAVVQSEFLEANIGQKVRLRTGGDRDWIEGTIRSVVSGQGTPGEQGDPSFRGGFRAPFGGVLVLLETADGLRPLSAAEITGLVLPATAKTTVTGEEMLPALSLRFDPAAANQEAEVGMMYLQKGLRWIPNYKIVGDGNGKAKIDLQAILINDLTDLSDVALNLVVGVPTFAFKDTPDPIGLQDTFARLSRYFSPDSPTASNFSNAIVSQSRMGEQRGLRPERSNPGEPGAPVPEFSGAEQNEDLFLFSLKHISLKTGERMTLPVNSFSVPYQDIYRLELTPTVPTPQPYGSPQEREIVRLVQRPNVFHLWRLRNTSAFPLTTAPALLMNGGRIVAQNMVTFTASGATTDLMLTNATDLTAKHEDTEVSRTPNAATFDGVRYTRIDLKGEITLTSFRKSPSTFEVVRYVIGEVSAASAEATMTPLDPANDTPEIADFRGRNPALSQYNKITRIAWKVVVPPGRTLTLTYQWNYLFR
ncbi:MAG: hypothetical protein SFU56_05615 [Capsulimonadales bacterium]|nr:hypothetical protein [Capsulimonadales bacterium]